MTKFASKPHKQHQHLHKAKTKNESKQTTTMFRKLQDRISSAAASAFGTQDPNVTRLTAMGFSEESATQALAATNNNVDRAAELLLASGSTAQNAINVDDEDATLQRVMQESLALEEQRRQQQQQQTTPKRTAAMNKAAEAAQQRAAARNNKAPQKTRPAPVHKAAQAAEKRATAPAATTTTTKLTASKILQSHHPDVKIIPKLQDKSKEEQILRCTDRMKNHPQAVDTLLKALTAVQKDPNNDKFRKIDKSTAGYQRSVAPAPGAEALLHAMNYRISYNPSQKNTLILDRAMVDPALLYLGVSALEQTKETNEYKTAKALLVLNKQVEQIMASADNSTEEAIQRSAYMSKCPTEPPSGRGALMQVKLGSVQEVRRRFDGDDTLEDVLNWLGGHGSVIPEKLETREWSLVDLNHYPIEPMDCSRKNARNTLQYLGCWPSGKLEIRPSTEEWKASINSKSTSITPPKSRGLGAHS